MPYRPTALPPSHSLLRAHVLCTQAYGVAVSGSYAYVAALISNALVVVDVSNPTSPVIRGSVVSPSLLVQVRRGAATVVELGRSAVARRACVRSIHHARTSAAPPPSDALSRAFTRSLSRAVHTQARGVAVSGSYAYVAAYLSNALVVVDVSNPASPVIRGSVVSSSLLNGVRAIQFCDRSLWRGWRRAPRLRRHLPSYSHPQRHRLLMPSRAFTRSLSRAVHAGYRRRRERLVCIRGGACILLAGCGRH
jgi:hypothetical protein